MSLSAQVLARSVSRQHRVAVRTRQQRLQSSERTQAGSARASSSARTTLAGSGALRSCAAPQAAERGQRMPTAAPAATTTTTTPRTATTSAVRTVRTDVFECSFAALRLQREVVLPAKSGATGLDVALEEPLCGMAVPSTYCDMAPVHLLRRGASHLVPRCTLLTLPCWSAAPLHRGRTVPRAPPRRCLACTAGLSGVGLYHSPCDSSSQ